MAVIPARGGSVGIPRKNLVMVSGRPLLAHTVAHARAASSVDRVFVSTDDEEIASVAEVEGAEVIRRPESISGHDAASEEALAHVLNVLGEDERYEPELVALLQCTSPIRKPGDVDAAIAALRREDADSLLSVVRSHRFLWRVVDGFAESVNYDFRLRPRRQDRREFAENGSIYVMKPWVLREHKNRLGGRIALYEMDYWTQFDIDEPGDIALCDWILRTQTLT